MIPDWQMTLIKRAALGQLRPDQIAWFDKYKAIPTDVMIQFALSPEGATLMQQAVDVIIAGTDAMFTRVAQISQAQMALAAPAQAAPPPAAPVQEVVQTPPVVQPTQSAPIQQLVSVANPGVLLNPATNMPYIS